MLLGGAMLWTPGRRLLISGNEKAYFPQAAQEYLEEHFPSIPPESYRDPDVCSPDTLASAKNVPTILRREGLTIPLIASVGKHGIRAARMYYQERVNVQGIAVTDDIVARRSPEDKAMVEKWKYQLTTILEESKEALLRIGDKKGNKSKLVTKLFRP